MEIENKIEFKIIPGLEDYAISKNGVVKALPKIREGNLSVLNSHHGTNDKSQRHYKERILKQSFKQRYWYVNLTHNGRPTMSGHIGDVCNNKRKTSYGYKWKWKENSL